MPEENRNTLPVVEVVALFPTSAVSIHGAWHQIETYRDLGGQVLWAWSPPCCRVHQNRSPNTPLAAIEVEAPVPWVMRKLATQGSGE